MFALAGGEAGLNRAVHIWQDPGFIYLSNPICACSTLKLSLNLSVARHIGDHDFAVTHPTQIHNRAHNLLKTPLEIGYDRFLAMLDDPAVPVFTFVRSPLSRVLSAFRKKLSGETKFVARARAHLGLPPDAPRADFLTLSHFVEYLWRDPAFLDLDVHWRLQRRQVLFDEIPRLTCFRVESFDRDAAQIFTRIFGPDHILRDASSLNPANRSASRKAQPALSDLDLSRLTEAYAPDLQMLDEITRRTGAPE